MGKKEDDIEREIEALRADTDLVLEELERRLKDTIDVRAQAEQHPFITTAILLGLATSLGLLVYNAYFRQRVEVSVPYARSRSHRSFFTRLKEFSADALEVTKPVFSTFGKD